FLTATQNGKAGALLTLDRFRVGQGLWASSTPDGFSQSIQIFASGATPGLLQPGESVRVPVYYAGWLTDQWDSSRPPIIFSLGVLKADDPTPIDWAALQDGLQPPSIAADAWDAIYPNLTTQMGNTWGSYLAQIDTDATYLAQIGEPTTDIGQLWGFEV